MSAKRKTCIKCGAVKAAGEFPAGRRQCKTCVEERHAQWAKANPEKVAAKSRR
jgi:hypothetical protein